MTLTAYRKLNNRPTVSRVFEDLFSNTFDHFLGNEQLNNRPAVNILKKEDGFSLELATPGFSKSQLTLKVEEGELTISGSTSATHIEDNSQAEAKNEESQNEQKAEVTVAEPKVSFVRREFAAANFSRTFTLPENADENNISAQYENGVLALHIPFRAEEAKPVKHIAIS